MRWSAKGPGTVPTWKMQTKEDTGRSLTLLRAFRDEQSDPARFYCLLADDSVRQVARYLELKGQLVLDIGGGEGYFSQAFRRAEAVCVLVEPERGAIEINDATGAQTPFVIGNGSHLPFATGTVDVSFASNVLEHVPEPTEFVAEMVRVTRPGGIVYVSFTNWYSPWGGHGTSPWHYLGGSRALRRFERRRGHPPINRFGENLFPTHVGPMLRWARENSSVEVLEAVPRYHPRWCHWLVRVPLLREVATWNLLLILRRRS